MGSHWESVRPGTFPGVVPGLAFWCVHTDGNKGNCLPNQAPIVFLRHCGHRCCLQGFCICCLICVNPFFSFLFPFPPSFIIIPFACVALTVFFFFFFFFGGGEGGLGGRRSGERGTVLNRIGCYCSDCHHHHLTLYRHRHYTSSQ